jgi:peptidoglycan/xylan/chitin deacetylase (PgdA/CDA1 family)
VSGCVALMYHIVDDPRSDAERQWCCSPAAFRGQMQLLRESGYHPVSMSDLVRWVERRADLPPKPVCITIDDGTRCIVDTVLPVLSELSFPAIAYVVSGRIGGDNDWLQHAGWAKRALVDEADLHALVRGGIEIGSHSVSHPDLTVETPERVDAEVRDSRHRLEDLLGAEVAHFAYPLGRLDARTRDAVAAAGYRSACTVADGWIRRGDDPFRLNRVEIYHWDGLNDFARKLRWAAADVELSVRSTRRFARRALQRIGLYDAYAATRQPRSDAPRRS